MDKKNLAEIVRSHLQVLCEDIGERRVGSKSNRQATAYAKKILEASGWKTTSTELAVIDWQTNGATLTCNDRKFEVFSSHYSMGCNVQGELVAVGSVRQLEQSNIKNKIVMLHGKIAAQQIAPKNFPFWNPEEHRHLVALLEQGRPMALVCATERNSATAGGVYPFPLFEDGDFDIPSVYMKDTEGKKLLSYTGHTINLESKAKRIPETAFNVTARKDDRMKDRIVITAHIDTKMGTPGAIDNATGVTIILALAEHLKDYSGKYPLELVIFNGEDYYGAPGQVRYINQHSGKFSDIILNINIDGAGYKEGPSCFSPFGLPENIHETLKEVIWDMPEIVEGLPWYQGDHSLFLQQGRPAIAVSSQWFIENMECQELTHTPKDNLDVVDDKQVVACINGIADVISKI